nr:immunoglobulin light chain junction region [Macaca mulatta]MOW08262.1 immunoglobulin light chain junction region [Macaca mulatta]MOW08473.1 immunoglobulin light chain junction region [Macaca mulatta]MOW08695.1 immunoglobulin light chain junction region [Macaca mulatta]MOW09102.1 immunoglobulin light chain junction region [Macaca mulatta]
CLRYNSIPFTF